MSMPLRLRANAGPAIAAGEFTATSIDLYVTSACNRECSYCFLSDSYFASKSHMPVAMVRDILDWAISGGTIAEVTLLGGEPASHPAFAAIVHTVAEYPLRLRVVTNGSKRFRAHLDSERVRHSFDRIAVSLDAPDAVVVDRLRGPGAYEDALATIARLREVGIPFDINCTAVASAVDSLPELLAFADAAGAGRLNIHWFSIVGRGRQHAGDEAVSARQWRDKVLGPVARYQPSRDGFVVDCELGFAFGWPGEDRTMCAVRDRSNLQFFPDGGVFSCGIAVEDPALSGYRWRDGQLVARHGRSELALAAGSCDGCPLREPSDGFTPVCVYHRLAR